MNPTITGMTFHTPPSAPSDLPDSLHAADPQRFGSLWGRTMQRWRKRVKLPEGLVRRLAFLGDRLARAEQQVTERFRVPPGGG